MKRRGRADARRAGLTLVEVLLAVAILGGGLSVLLLAVQRGLAVARRAAHFENARRLAGAVELHEPLDVEEELDFPREGRFEPPYEEYTWRRELRHAAGPDLRLYEVETRIGWSDRGRDAFESFVTLRFVPDESGGVFERAADAAAPAPGGAPPARAPAAAPGRTPPDRAPTLTPGRAPTQPPGGPS